MQRITKATPAKPRFDGATLILPRWKFTVPYPRVPHRRYNLASHIDGKVSFYVNRNHRSFRALYWLHATGPGFAGDNSRASNTFTTRNQEVADKWIAAVSSGNVRLED